MSVRTWVELGPSLDAADWERLHLAGEVPDAAPYGLHKLGRHGFEVGFRPPPTTGFSVAAHPLRRLTGLQWVEAVSRPPPAGTDVCVAWDERAGVPRAALSGRSLPTATGVIWLDDPAGSRGRTRAVESLRRCGLVWALSRAQLPALHDLGIPTSRLAHLLFGVDARFFAPSDASACDPGLVVSVGNDRHRDWSTLTAAFTELRRRRPSVRLEVVTRAELPPVTGMTAHPRMGHTELRRLYSRASVVVIATRPNRHVSGMTAALEAQAVARPVVLTGTEGAEDYLEDGRAGHLVPAGEPRALARLIDEVLGGGVSLVGEMGSHGRRAVDERLSSDHMAARLADLITRHC